MHECCEGDIAASLRRYRFVFTLVMHTYGAYKWLTCDQFFRYGDDDRGNIWASKGAAGYVLRRRERKIKSRCWRRNLTLSLKIFYIVFWSGFKYSIFLDLLENRPFYLQCCMDELKRLGFFFFKLFVLKFGISEFVMKWVWGIYIEKILWIVTNRDGQPFSGN